MPFNHQVKEDYVHFEWYGEMAKADLQEISALMPRIAASLQRVPHVLHCFDQITGSTLQPLDAFQHSLRLQDTHIPKVSKSAVVAKTETIRPMASLFCALNRHPNLIMELFTSERAAIAWLRGESPAPAASPKRGKRSRAKPKA